jgi:hypothetical protein
MARTIFIFGAGSSRGTLGAKVPTLVKFGNRLADVAACELDQVAKHLGGLWTCLDYHAKFGTILPTPALGGSSERVGS